MAGGGGSEVSHMSNKVKQVSIRMVLLVVLLRLVLDVKSCTRFIVTSLSVVYSVASTGTNTQSDKVHIYSSRVTRHTTLGLQSQRKPPTKLNNTLPQSTY